MQCVIQSEYTPAGVSVKETSVQIVTFYSQFHYLFPYNLSALLYLPSLNAKVLIHTLVGTHTSSGFDTQVQLPMMHLLP